MKCSYCHHADSKHCPGSIRHANYKDEQRQVRDARMHVCKTRHCLEPMCDCVDLKTEAPNHAA